MHIQILGKKRPLALGLLNRSCASAVFSMPPMPTMPTPASLPAPQSLNARDSSSVSCWSNPWILLRSSQAVVQHRGSGGAGAVLLRRRSAATGVVPDTLEDSAADRGHPLLGLGEPPCVGLREESPPSARAVREHAALDEQVVELVEALPELIGVIGRNRRLLQLGPHVVQLGDERELRRHRRRRLLREAIHKLPHQELDDFHSH